MDYLPLSFACLIALCGVVSCSTPANPGAAPALRYKLNGPLVPARMTMVTAWDVPKNPLSDPTLDQSTLSKEIQWGYRLFTNTPVEARRFVPGGVSCSHCPLNARQRGRAPPPFPLPG